MKVSSASDHAVSPTPAPPFDWITDWCLPEAMNPAPVAQAVPDYDVELTVAPEFDLVQRLIEREDEGIGRPARVVRFARAVVAGLFVSVVVGTLCHAHGRSVLLGTVGQHMVAGVFYASYLLIRRCGRHGPLRTGAAVETEVKREVGQAVEEGVLFGMATAWFGIAYGVGG